MTDQSKTDTATFAAGCFWGVEETFRRLPGVLETEAGYTGGDVPDPTYDMVCSNATGHAEAVRIVFDPGKISYEELLKVFFDNHNPTTPNRQGPDIGTQYRSVVFYHSDAQRDAAEKAKASVDRSGAWTSPVVTQIVPASTFYPAEAYHQKYLLKRGLDSCHI